MRRAPFIVLGMLAIPFLTTQIAQAADGKLSDAVEMRAGPSGTYPAVTRLAKGLSVDIHGCLKSWDWCDVSWRGNRGWVPASAITARQDDQRLPLVQYGPKLGVPEVTFQLNSYWDSNYSHSLWYGQRDTLRDSTAVRESAVYNPQ